MILSFLVGSMLLASPQAQIAAGQPPALFQRTQDPDEIGEKKPEKPITPPTPWWTKQEDSFDEPSDPRRQKQLKDDIAEGKKYADEVLRSEKPSTNMEYQERVERIGQELAHIANHSHLIALWGDRHSVPYHYHFVVLQGEDINAFSLPGGYIFVYEGLMKFVESDDELAGVLGHEITHAALRHVPTLEHEQNKAQIYEIPALLAAIISRSPGAVYATEGFSMAQESHWSIQAEKAADYGGFQILEKSQYNPVAMLTFMERLHKESRFIDNFINNTIFQDHPITQERAEAFEQDLKNAGIPIERSKASPSYRIILKNKADGTVDAFFDSRKIFTFAGPDARERAESAQQVLDKFYDTVPAMYDVNENSETNSICWHEQPILTITADDAEAAKTTEDKLLRQTLQAIKNSLFLLGYRVWTGD